MPLMNFSATRLWARIMGQLFRTGRAFVGARQNHDATPIDARITQQSEALDFAMTELERLRADLCQRLDQRARRVLPWVPLAVLVLLIVLYGWDLSFRSLPKLALLLALSIAVAWLLQHRPAQLYRQTMRTIIGRSVAIALHDFTHEPAPVISKDKLRGWPLFPHVSAVTGIDLFKGQRNEHEVTVCRLQINYHHRTRQRRKHDRHSALHAICIKLDASPLANETAVLLPDMVDIRIHNAVTKKHGLAVTTPLQGAGYNLLSFTQTETAFAQLQANLADATLATLQQLGAPILLFHARQTIALFPLESDILVPFAPQPYWQNIDRTRLLSEMNRDLAQLEARLDAALALQKTRHQSQV